MSDTPGERPDPREENNVPGLRIILSIMLILVVATAITLLTLRQSSYFIYTEKAVTIPETLNPSPFGYTWSLVLFIIPALTIKIWFLRHPRFPVEKRAYWTTVLILTPLGFTLDTIFGLTFFNFRNTDSVAGIYLPGYVFGEGWTLGIPIEEFAFYLLGFIAILLSYVWADIYWLGAYRLRDYPAEARRTERVISFNFNALLLGIGLIIFAFIFKYFGPHAHREGFPGYFIFITLVGIVPAMGLYNTARRLINWRAFSFSLISLLMVSLLWEGTLGVPYAWWGYNLDQMIGITMPPWANLPLEAVIIWFSTTWTTIIVYEVIRLVLHAERPAREFLLSSGRKGL